LTLQHEFNTVVGKVKLNNRMNKSYWYRKYQRWKYTNSRNS